MPGATKRQQPNGVSPGLKVPHPAHSRSDCLLLARVAEKAARFPDMVQFVNYIAMSASSGSPLSPEERTVFFSAHKNSTDIFRANWRSALVIQQRDAPRYSRRRAMFINKEIKKLENEVSAACKSVLSLLDKYIIPASSGGEELVFYHKMKGDYYRYLAEITHQKAEGGFSSSSLEAYKQAYRLALGALDAAHPTRLGLALNFSVYYHDVYDSPERACHLAKHAFDEALIELDKVPSGNAPRTAMDSLQILQLLMDDMRLWFGEIQSRDALEAHVMKTT